MQSARNCQYSVVSVAAPHSALSIRAGQVPRTHSYKFAAGQPASSVHQFCSASSVHQFCSANSVHQFWSANSVHQAFVERTKFLLAVVYELTLRHSNNSGNGKKLKYSFIIILALAESIETMTTDGLFGIVEVQ